MLELAFELETIAAIPGFVAGGTLHLNTLRSMRHNQWIKFVMDESENERMHLMTFMELWQPSHSQRALVIGAQAVFCVGYWA